MQLFFDACDGIFLNYRWNETMLANSANLAGERKMDVFTGIDLFGTFSCFQLW